MPFKCVSHLGKTRNIPTGWKEDGTLLQQALRLLPKV